MTSQDDTAGPQPVVRLIFAVKGDTLTLVDRRDVVMTLPPAAPPGAEDPPPEFAAELRRADGRVLHRVRLRNPLEANVEVYEGTRAYRAEVRRSGDVLGVDLPAHEEADHVALVTTRPPGRDPSLAPLDQGEELVRVSLREGEAGA